MKVGIIGYGWVGKAMHELFPDAVIYSRNLVRYADNWIRDPIAWQKDEVLYKDAVNRCDIVFICVPTPVIDEGKLDTSIVEEMVKWCKADLLVIRSTVNPGDCERWEEKYRKYIIFQPEYLGETPQHPLLDTKETPFLIIGGLYENRQKLIELYQTVYNANIKIRQTSHLTAEVIKLSENRAISFKVAQCQELYDVCKKEGIDYNEVREAVYGDDPRFNLWWTFVYPDKRGFNSKCIPKDVYAWCAWAESLGYEPKITRTLLEKNKEWINA